METKRTIEEKVEFGDSITLEKVKVNEKDYFLQINNAHGNLVFNFYEKRPSEDESPDYSIIIDEKGIRFHRHVYRPHHDHDDGEDLQVVTDSKEVNGIPNGTLIWHDRFPYDGEGRDFLKIEFGSEESDC
ncbi:MAG: hypothetical protein Q7S33_05820 [Nanoarchaeota archaeon]|nr:hypothetical protein [Nanoarchaeota archaeon]